MIIYIYIYVKISIFIFDNMPWVSEDIKWNVSLFSAYYALFSPRVRYGRFGIFSVVNFVHDSRYYFLSSLLFIQKIRIKYILQSFAFYVIYIK